ncbi:hypothetical protein [Roseitranquillus sediminis]|uniref:hypothetical protein n=1 Tax=Roseitranquillus sediminis TaxID=2809051 RepID=UPI001D0CA0D5|nr:hypothetical protein [Roseitranquillus sediminis]
MMGYGWNMHAGGLFWMLIIGLLWVIPFWKLLPRYGIPSWVAILSIFPLVALILLWIMAFRDRIGGGTA